MDGILHEINFPRKISKLINVEKYKKNFYSCNTGIRFRYEIYMSNLYVCMLVLSKNLKIKIYRTIILPVVLHGCETWSLTLREERKLRVFENMVLRRLFGLRRDDVTGEWRRLHNEELNDLYCSPYIVQVIKSRRMRWAGDVARMGEERGCIGSWWGNRRERDHWEDIGVDGWIKLGWISRRWDVGIWTGLGWSRIETGGGRL